MASELLPELREEGDVMNRTQAEHILEAYVHMRMRMRESDKDASDALREVILDAMADCKPGGITMSSPWRVETVPCSHPTNWDGTAKMTCTGIDHAFNQVTGVDA